MLLDSVCAIVDLETTGTSAASESITEVGLRLIDCEGTRFDFQRLVNPYRSIPPFISSLTGISNAMVENEAGFDELAPELWSLINDTVFIAHNARFDYSFLKSAFSRSGYEFKPRIICTVKLARALFPEWQGYSLGKIIARIDHQASARHRAMADVESTEAFLNYAIAKHGLTAVNEAAAKQLKNAATPCHLDPTDISALPEEPGVYYFYGEKGSLLYVGKSKSIRSRVKSHFAADIREAKEMRMAQEIRTVEHRCCAGELGALLLENHDIKMLQPIYNRRLRPMKKMWSVHLSTDKLGYEKTILAQHETSSFEAREYFGIYSSRSSATKMLEALAVDHGLCKKMLGLEKGNGACFAYQLKKCSGACKGLESAVDYNARLLLALQQKKIEIWPYPGRIAIIESHATKHFCDVHLVDNWAYQSSWRIDNPGTMDCETLDESYIKKRGIPISNIELGFDKDTYKILQKFIRREHSPYRSVVNIEDPKTEKRFNEEAL